MCHNRILLSFSPILRRKKKDKSGVVNEVFEDLFENDLSNQHGESAQELSFGVNGPSDQTNEESKNDERMLPDREDVKGK